MAAFAPRLIAPPGHRRNRHFEKQFIRNTLAHLPRIGRAEADPQGLVLPPDRPLRAEEAA